jgi:hypothetical protein
MKIEIEIYDEKKELTEEFFMKLKQEGCLFFTDNGSYMIDLLSIENAIKNENKVYVYKDGRDSIGAVSLVD